MAHLTTSVVRTYDLYGLTYAEMTTLEAALHTYSMEVTSFCAQELCDLIHNQLKSEEGYDANRPE